MIPRKSHHIPEEETKLLFKVFSAIFILTSLVFVGAILIDQHVHNFQKSLFQSIVVVTGATIPNGGTSFGLMFLSIMGVVLNFYIFYIIIEFVLEGKMNKIFRGVRSMRLINKLKDHYIICGGGRVGINVAKELVQSNKKVIIIEKNPALFEKIENIKIPLLKGDALDETNLKRVNIQGAKFLIACLDNDGDNIILTLTAKEMNPKIRVGARANEEVIVKKLYHAGAEYVVLPEVVGGVQLAKSVIKQ